MKFDELTPDNWTLFAIKNYNNPQSVTYSDFEEDIKKFKYIKRLFRRFETTGELKKHLILNHIILLYNVFGDAATPLNSRYLHLYLVMEEVCQEIIRMPSSLANNYLLS